MKKIYLFIVISIIMISCKERPTFQFETTSDRLTEIIEWRDKLLVKDNIGVLYSIEEESLKKFKADSIVSISKCNNDYYILKAPNDSTFIIIKPDHSEWLVRNNTEFKSEYFSIQTNEKYYLNME